LFSNLANLFRYRGLIQSLVARELKARYRGSALGFVWSFVNPLLLLLIYTYVFTAVMPNETEGVQPYALFMFCGILPWTWFSSSLSESANSLIAGGNLIKKVLFPAEVLPIVSVLTNMVHFFLGLPILIAFLIVYQHYPRPENLLWFPIVVIVQLVFTVALALILSALSVLFRDIKDILANLLTLWFFATPIIYPWFQPSVQKFHTFFDINPFTHLAVTYQEVLFFNQGPVGHWKWLLGYLGVGSVVLFLAGYWLFDRLRDSFAEAV
jgi:lipopolysaccharide transport system permease protein